MKPEEIITDPCVNCERRNVDDWGYICDISCGGRTAYLNQLKGADAMWRAVSDKLADMSNGIKDDKMFRIKLFLWLTEEVSDE